MLDQVLRTIRRFGMIAPGQRIAVACSGGPDSTGLLLALHQLSAELGCALQVAHFNHLLRGDQSAADEQFVRELAGRMDLPLQVSVCDVRRRAREARANLEETARRLRYEFFFSLVESGQTDRVAVGHTADDQAETVLHRLVRGAGIRGLAGIYPVMQERVIRPLIEVRRHAVLAWLEAEQQPWRDDPTNRDRRFLRNRLRHELLPLLAGFNPRIVEILSDTAEIARDEEAFWERYLAPVLAQRLGAEEGRVWVEIEPLREMPRAVARRVLRCAVERLARKYQDQSFGSLGSLGFLGSLDFGQTQRLLDVALEGQSGSAVSLGRGLVARKEYSRLVVRRGAPARQPFPGYRYGVRPPAVVEVPELSASFAFELIALPGDQARYNEEEGELLDSQVAGSTLVLRNWQPGDAYQRAGHLRSRKLKDLFQRRRIGSAERQKWPVVLAQDQILWSRGLGVAEGFAPRPGSREALRIRETRWQTEVGE